MNTEELLLEELEWEAQEEIEDKYNLLEEYQDAQKE